MKIDELDEECNENIDEKESYLAKLHAEETISSCIIYIILFYLFFTINIGNCAYFVYF